MFQIADLRGMSEEGISVSWSDVEYLPNLFNELTARIEDVYVEMHNPLEARVVVGFVFEAIDKEVSDARARGTPNFVVFYGPKVYLTDKDAKITNEKDEVISFDSREQSWSVFVPDSYPPGGFSNPVPICEWLMFFNGVGRIFYWKLSPKTKYKLELWVRRSNENGPFQFGLLLPYKRTKTSVAGICIESKDNFVMKQGFLKRIPYTKSRKAELRVGQFLDFTNYKKIYRFEGDGVHKLERFDPTLLVETDDFEVLGIETWPLRQGAVSRFNLFPFLKRDLDFRKEVGKDEYTQLIQEIRRLPEKCQKHTTATMCRECATQIKNLCLVNLLGIVCDSDVLPHHGFEYPDLLIKTSDEKRLIVPVLVKGPTRLTWKRDLGLTRQLLEKLSDKRIEVIIVATSGQIGNRLRIQLENLTNIQGKSLILLGERELAQFLAELKQLKG